MKRYNNYNYISPNGIINEVKKRLNQYFALGQLDEAMLGIYIEHAMRKFGVGGLEKTYAILKFEDYKARKPEDFHKLNVVYKCDYNTSNSLTASSLYTSEGFWSKSVRCTDCDESCDPETETFEQLKVALPGLPYSSNYFYNPRLIRVGISKDQCVTGCLNTSYTSEDEITIGSNYITATFETGYVFFSYYALLIDESDTGYPMIIDEVWFTDYVKGYIMYQYFEDLLHVVTDETANQIMQKYQMYKQDYQNLYQSAKQNLIAPTKLQIRDSIARDRNRLNNFEIR